MSSDNRGRGARELNALNLKALVHPLRVRVLGSLREEGPATATALAARFGESSGALSYHLRQLERFGFIEEAEGRGSGRERWWKAAQASTVYDEARLLKDPATRTEAADFLRTIAAGASGRMLEWIEALPRMPEDYAAAGTMSDWGLRLGAEELARLKAELEAVIASYQTRQDEAEARGEGRFVSVQLQLLPRIEA